LADLRNLAAIYMSYNTMLRIAELSRLRVGDLRYQPNGTILVNVRYKTDVDVLKILGRKSAAIVTRWLKASGLVDDPEAFVLAPVTRFNTVRKMNEPMGRPALGRILPRPGVRWKRIAKTNKGRYATWTGHSCRVGAAQDLLLNG
jgi:integrase